MIKFYIKLALFEKVANVSRINVPESIDMISEINSTIMTKISNFSEHKVELYGTFASFNEIPVKDEQMSHTNA